MTVSNPHADPKPAKSMEKVQLLTTQESSVDATSRLRVQLESMLTTCESASAQAKLKNSNTSSAKLKDAHEEAFASIKACFQFVKLTPTLPKASAKDLSELSFTAIDLVTHLLKSIEDPEMLRELKFMEKAFKPRKIEILPSRSILISFTANKKAKVVNPMVSPVKKTRQQVQKHKRTPR